jgi:hypothetical protein
MQFRVTLSWITVTLLALSAEGSAVAQSAPARADSAGDPPGRIEQGSASAGPELEAARASLGTTKKSDTGAAVNLHSLANRQVAAGSTAASGLALPTGAGAPIQSNAGGGESLQALHGDATGITSATAGPAIRFVPVGGLQGGGAAMSAPAPHAEAVLRGQINPAAKSCYENDPDSRSRRPGKLVILIKLTAAGEIDSVSESSNIGMSPSVVSCITTAARAAKFAAPGANGATVRAAFTFPGREDVAPLAAARAMDAQVANAPAHAAPPTLAKADTQPTNGETAHR